MKDLIITYTSENKVIKKEYDHIFDFTDEIEDTQIQRSKEELISTNMGDIPKRDYLDIKAQQYGFDDYADMRSQGLVLDI